MSLKAIITPVPGEVSYSSTPRIEKRCQMPEYAIWNAMRARCHNPKHKRFSDYGGRGITVCDRWRDSFEDFLTDVGSRPSSDLTLDRIDNNGNYEPGNVRWVSMAAQAENRRNNVLITFNGRTQIASVWARELGVNREALCRKYLMGFGLEEILSEKPRKSGPKVLKRPDNFKKFVAEYTGKKFGRLLVTELTRKDHPSTTNPPYKKWWAECTCDCGSTRGTWFAYLKSGMTSSCGCARRENMRQVGHARHQASTVRREPAR